MTKANTYEAGFIDGLEYAMQLNLEEVLKSVIEIVRDFRERKSMLDKCEFVIRKLLALVDLLRKKFSFFSNGDDLV